MAQESQQESGLSADEIIHLAHSKGYTISKRQLSRWQNLGLIPRPYRIDREGVSGSSWRYPTHAGEQTCSVCKITEHFRDHKRIGWYLWRLGWPVHDQYWKPVFAEAIEFLDNFLRPNVEPAEGQEYPSNRGPKFELSDRFLEEVQKASQQPISHPKAGPMKQRMGAEQFVSMIVRCLEIMVGNFSRDAPVEQAGRSDSDLSLKKILGRAFAEDEQHTELMTKVFEFLSDKTMTGTLADQFRRIPADQLQLVSREILHFDGLLPALMGKNDEIPKVNGIPAFSLKSNIREQAILILGWSVARQMKENAENLEKFYMKNEILPS